MYFLHSNTSLLKHLKHYITSTCCGIVFHIVHQIVTEIARRALNYARAIIRSNSRAAATLEHGQSAKFSTETARSVTQLHVE